MKDMEGQEMSVSFCDEAVRIDSFWPLTFTDEQARALAQLLIRQTEPDLEFKKTTPPPIPGAEVFTAISGGSEVTYLTVDNEVRKWDSENFKWAKTGVSAGYLRRQVTDKKTIILKSY